MINRNKDMAVIKALRKKAENRMKIDNPKLSAFLEVTDSMNLIQELKIHKVELEIQNEVIREERDEKEQILVKYRELFDFAPTGYFLIDHEGIIYDVNHSGAFLIGREKGKILKKNFRVYIAENYLMAFDEFINYVFETSEKESCELLLNAYGKAPVYVHAEGVCMENGKKCLLNLADLTESKKFESEIISQERKFRTLSENSTDYITRFDLSKICTYANPLALELYGEDIIGKSWLNSKASNTFIRHLNEKSAVVLKSGKPVSFYYIFKSHDSKKHLTTRIIPELNPDGNIESLMVISTDISDHIAAEKQKRENEKQRREIEALIEKSSHLASIGVITGGIAHEINQPLNAIRMGSEGILFWNKRNKNVLPGVMLEMIEGISSGVKRIDEIIKSLRSFWENKDNDSVDIVDINKAIKNVISISSQKIHNHGIHYNLYLCEEILPVRTNTLRLELVINNLIINSIYSMNRKEDRDKYLIVKSYKNNEKAFIDIIDSGVGLPDSIPKEKLFEPFFTTRFSEGGSGLGLAIVKMFMDKYNGQVDAFNNGYGGATFRLIFDIYEEKQE